VACGAASRQLARSASRKQAKAQAAIKITGAHSAEESKRVLSVGKELVGETMPLRHGRRVYRVDGLRPSA